MRCLFQIQYMAHWVLKFGYSKEKFLVKEIFLRMLEYQVKVEIQEEAAVEETKGVEQRDAQIEEDNI